VDRETAEFNSQIEKITNSARQMSLSNEGITVSVTFAFEQKSLPEKENAKQSMLIEDKIHIPPRKHLVGTLRKERKPQGPHNTQPKYPVPMLSIGQSFLVPPSLLPPGGQESVRVAAYRLGGRYGMKTTTRNVKGGVRVWRIA